MWGAQNSDWHSYSKCVLINNFRTKFDYHSLLKFQFSVSFHLNELFVTEHVYCRVLDQLSEEGKMVSAQRLQVVRILSFDVKL